jgi:2-keto-3-deoxygluconate permease
MQIPIKATLDRIPGGTMVVPLFIGAIAHTFWPSAGDFFGSFTGALLEGAVPLSAAFFVCLGTTIEFKSTGQILLKGGSLLAAKVLSALVIGVIAARFLGEGEISSGAFAGLSVLALVASMNDTNGTMFVTLMQQFGRPKDAAAYGVMSIESGPFFTMFTLGAAGLAAFPWQAMLGAVLPLIVGAILGNIDRSMRDWLSPACGGLIPIIAFALGFLGIGLGFFVFLWTGLFLYGIDRLTKGTGVAGMAAATTSGSAIVVPSVVAEVNPAYQEAASSATVLVAASVVVTAILAPFGTAFAAKLAARRLERQEQGHTTRTSSNTSGPTPQHVTQDV